MSLDSVFEFGEISAEDESCIYARKLYVGEDLRLMVRINSLNTFQLDNQSFLEQQVHWHSVKPFVELATRLITRAGSPRYDVEQA